MSENLLRKLRGKFGRRLLPILLLGFCQASAFGQALPELIYYKFDGSGTSVTNHAKSPVGSNPASISGSSLTQGGTGQFGGGLQGTGATSNYVTTGWNTNLGTGAWTIALYLNGVPSSSTLFYYFGDAGASSFRCFTNGVAGANNLMLRGPVTDVTIADGAKIGVANVCHFVYDPSAGNIKGYRNGTLVTTVSQGALNITSGTGLTVGGYATNAGLSGTMDEFRLYNRALSATEIAATWNKKLGAIAANDAAVTALDSPYAFCPGTLNIKARVENSGINQIKSLKINWSLNGVTQTAVTYSGTLDTSGGSGSTSASVKLGSHTFAANTPVTIKVWTSNPNSAADTVNDNDTITQVLMASLSGSYTVGGTSPDYATLQAAMDDLAAFGVCGPVTLNVRAGTHSGRTVTKEIPGTSATNTVTVKGASKTTSILTNAGTATTNFQTIVVNGTDYLIFKDLTIEATGTTYGTCIHFTGGADHNTVENCDLKMPSSASNAYNIGILGSGSPADYTSYGTTGRYNLFKDNTITGGAYGIRFLGSGATATPGANGNMYVGNSITNYYNYGMYIYYSDSSYIHGNTVTTSRYASAYGVVFYYGANFEISNNNINVPYYALYMYYSNYYAWNGKSQALVANNMVLGTGTGYTLYAPYNYYVNYYYNTFQAGGTGTYNAYFSGATGVNTGVNLVGNIFVHRGSNTTLYYTTAFPNSVDYNIYHKPSAGNFAYMGGVTFTDLSNWQTAYPDFNKNSLQQDPGFKSTTDLHLDNAGSVKPWGPDLGLTTDVDGDVRCKFAPTIGADESILGKTTRPSAGVSGPDTVFVNSPTEFLGNMTPGVPHTNFWYLDNVLLQESTDVILKVSATGTYKLKVVAAGCSLKDSVTMTIYVVNPTKVPNPDFIGNTNQAKIGETVRLFDLSSGGATRWAWDISPKTTLDAGGNPVDRYAFTDGTDDSSQNPVIRFDYSGVYKVCLTAVNSVGSATQCKTAYIRVLPGYDLGLTAPYAAEETGYIYDDGGLNGNYTISSSGTPRKTSILIAPCASEVYLVFNSFELECGFDYLRIYDGEDNTGTPLHACTGNANGGNGPGLTGTTGSTCAQVCRPTMDTLTATSGKMYIEMTSDDGINAAGFEAFWWSKPKTVNPPVASFDVPSTICLDMPLTFTNTTTGESAQYQWDLDGNISDIETTSQDAAYAYFVPGKYEITLIATNCGGTDTFSKEITVIAPNAPDVAFSADNVNPTTTDVVAFTPDISECVSDYFWRFTADAGPGAAVFMNGTKNTSMSPQVMFTDTGCYTAFLYAKNAGGADSLELTCYINVKDPYCLPSVTNSIPDIGISHVSIKTDDDLILLSNTSSSGVEDYQNFVATVGTTLERGVSYDLTVSRPTNLNEVTRTMWIDWNLDGDFTDAGEKVAEEKKSTSLSWTTTFKVPLTITTGASVMRIAINQGNLPNAVCGPNKYGEYEDYRIYLTPDLTAPVITMLGDDTVYVEQGYAYTEAGATADDNLDGNITSSIVKKETPTFDNLIPGLYTISFNVADKAGNKAETVNRIVIVTPDMTPPTLVLSGTDTIYVAVGDKTYSDPVPMESEDLVDGNMLSAVVQAGSADPEKVGIYTITYSVADVSGNSITRTRTIIVQDLIPPVITLTDPDTVYHEVNTPYTDAGVSFSDNYCAQADMAANLVMTGNIDVAHTGVYTVVYNLEDCNGNEAVPVVRVVIVRDTKAPVISLKGTDPVLVDVFTTYQDAGVNVTDNYGTPELEVTGTFITDFPNGKATKLGDYTIIYTATDSAGNTSSLTRIVRVVDREAPEIMLDGFPTANICRWASYTDPGYSVTDNYNTETELKITQEGDFMNTLIAGIYSLRYRAEDASGNVSYSSWRMIRVVEAGGTGCTSGLGGDGTLEEKLSVYPNPSRGLFTLSFELGSQEQVSVKVVNALGQDLQTVAGGLMQAGTVSVDLTNAAGGVYFLHITAGDKTAVKRVVVQR